MSHPSIGGKVPGFPYNRRANNLQLLIRAWTTAPPHQDTTHQEMRLVVHAMHPGSMLAGSGADQCTKSLPLIQ